MKIVENVRTRRYDVWMLPSRAYIPLLAVRGFLIFVFCFGIFFFPFLAAFGLWSDLGPMVESLTEDGVLGGALIVVTLAVVVLLATLAAFLWTIKRDKIVHQVTKGRVKNVLPHSKIWALYLLIEDEGYFFRWQPSVPNLYRFLKYHSARKRFKVLAVALFTAFAGGNIAFLVWWLSSDVVSSLPFFVLSIFILLLGLLSLLMLTHTLWLRQIAPATEPGDVRQTAGEEG